MVAVVGRKNSGKTTLIVKLANELAKDKIKVAVIKHSLGAHYELDPKGKDTYRYVAEADTLGFAFISKTTFCTFRWTCEEAPLEAALAFLYGVSPKPDIIFVEGFRLESYEAVKMLPKIAIIDSPNLPIPENTIAVATVGEFKPKAKEGVPVFRRDEVGKIAGFLKERVLSRKEGGASVGVTLMVDGKVIPINKFVKTVLANVIKGVVLELKGIEKGKSILVNIEEEGEDGQV